MNTYSPFQVGTKVTFQAKTEVRTGTVCQTDKMERYARVKVRNFKQWVAVEKLTLA